MLSVMVLGAQREAASILVRILEEEPNTRVKLQAINALTQIGASDEGTIAAMRRAQLVKNEYVSKAAEYHDLCFTGRYRPDAKIYGGVGGAPG